MKKILLHYPDDPQGNILRVSGRDNANDPYIALAARMHALGYDLQPAGDRPVSDCEWVLFFDASSVYGPPIGARIYRSILNHMYVGRGRDIYRACIAAGMASKVALFLWEAPAVEPRNWISALHALFPVIFTWHDDFAGRDQFHKIYVPQPNRFPPVQPRPFADKKLLVNISANKVSRHARELYSARRESIRYFERARPGEFDLYGIGWDKPATPAQKILRQAPAYPSYCGPVAHKWDIYPGYRFALCYENLRDEPGYLTEKIFDCMRADCVPIYWGDPHVTRVIPQGAFVDRRRFASDQELEHYLASLSEKDYQHYRAAIADFLASSQFRLFLQDAFVDRIISILGLSTFTERFWPGDKPAQTNFCPELAPEPKIVV